MKLSSIIAALLCCTLGLAQSSDTTIQRPRRVQPGMASAPTAEAGGETTAGSVAKNPFPTAPVHTKHTWGNSLPYTATCGFIPIKNADGETEASMFYEAYTKDGADPLHRPLTFCFNGGPGSSSVWLHMGAIGPKRAKMNDDGSLPPPPFELVENEESWLPFTDIVMIDMIGAGYSRPTKPEYGKKYWGLEGDLQAFTAFIRSFLSEYERWRSPLFVAGESYGGIRSAGLTDTLLQQGIALNGVISISGVMNYQMISQGKGNDLPFITYLPSETATAFYHHKLDARLQANFDRTIAESEQFASGEYAAALLKGDTLPEAQKKHIATRAAELTGLSPIYVERANLRIRPGGFRAELLRSNWDIVGRYDARLIGHNSDGNQQNPEYDPSDAATTPVFTAAFNDYIRRELNFKTDEPYRTTGYAFIGQWDYGTRGGFPDTSERLRAALTQNPYMKVMLVCGWYDLACPYYGMRYTMSHLGEEEKLQKNIRFRYYPAGHMMYIDSASRKKLQADVRQFVEDATR